MIFDWNACCTVAQTMDEQFPALLTLQGTGLWAGVLSSGQCVLDSAATPLAAEAGSLVLGAGPLRLTAILPCHLLAVRLTGFAPDAFLARLSSPLVALGSSCPLVAELLTRLSEQPASGTRQVSELAYSLLCELSSADASGKPLPPIVAAAIAAMRENYAGLYGVEELSDQLGVSKEHLVRTFRAAVGVPPGRYLIGVRVEAAKHLLLHRGYSLEVVASLCGFSGAGYLCRVFKKETGFTPAQWRGRRESLPDNDASQALPLEKELFV